jgi:hypothetical protein
MRGFVAEAFSRSVFQAVLRQSDFFVGDLFELVVCPILCFFQAEGGRQCTLTEA